MGLSVLRSTGVPPCAYEHYVGLEQYEKAIAVVKTAIEIDQDYESARWNLCIALFQSRGGGGSSMR